MRHFEYELKALNEQEGRAIPAQASCGVAVTRLKEYSTIEECIQQSDEEMYRTKERRHTARGN